MTRFVSIWLAMTILFQSANFGMEDMLKMDVLLEHAKFHSEKYGDDFFVFISKHYGEQEAEHSEEHGEEKKDHEQLPFNHQSCSHSLVEFVLNRMDSPLPKLGQDHTTSSNFFYKEPYSLFEKSNIFQPPRQA